MQTTYQVWASVDGWQTQYKASRVIYSREEAERQGRMLYANHNVSVIVEEFYADLPGVIRWQVGK
jgi:hypothetical protein